MTDLMNLEKFLLSLWSKVTTIPASSRLILTLFFSVRISLRTFSYSSQYQRYTCFIRYSLRVQAWMRNFDTYQMSVRKSQTQVKKLQGFSSVEMKMLPPWQSACTKLFFISISNRTQEPSLAITLLSGCRLVSQQVTGTPSTKLQTNTESLVLSSTGEGNSTSYRALNIFLNLLRLRISKVKSICQLRVFLSEDSLMGTSMAGEKKEARQLRKNNKFISLSMCLSTSGCLTLTATFSPLQTALQTWLTEPEAMGVVSNLSKMSLIFWPQASLKQFQVVQKGCVGAFSLKYQNLLASSGPMMSLRWLRYWKALMKTTPDLSIALTNRSDQQFLVFWKSSSGERIITGEKISSSCMNRRMCTRPFQILLQMEPCPGAVLLAAFTSLLSSCTFVDSSLSRLLKQGSRLQQTVAENGRMSLLSQRRWGCRGVWRAGEGFILEKQEAKSLEQLRNMGYCWWIIIKVIGNCRCVVLSSLNGKSIKLFINCGQRELAGAAQALDKLANQRHRSSRL